MDTNKNWWSTTDRDAEPSLVSEEALGRLLRRLGPHRHSQSDLVADGIEFPVQAFPLSWPYGGYVAFSGQGPLPNLLGWPHLPPPALSVLSDESLFSVSVSFRTPDRRLIQPFTSALVDEPLFPPEAFVHLSEPASSGDSQTAHLYTGAQFQGNGSKLSARVFDPDRIEEFERIVETATDEDRMVRELSPPTQPAHDQAEASASYISESPGAAVRVLGRLCDPVAGLGKEWSVPHLTVTHIEEDWESTYDALRRAAAVAPLGGWSVTAFVSAEYDPAVLDSVKGVTDHFSLPILTFQLRTGEWAVLQVSWERGRPSHDAYGVDVAVYAPASEAERLAWTFLNEEVSAVT